MKHRHPPTVAAQTGFTLVEVITVIVITSILAIAVVQFMRTPITAYLDTVRRQKLADAADTAFRRIAREVRAALPNSLRVTTSTAGGITTSYLEFVPVLDAGRYRLERSTALDNPLDIVSADSSFDILGPTITVPASGTYYVVISNWGASGGDYYEGLNRALYTGATATPVQTLNFTSTLFPIPSPEQRFFISGVPVSFVCTPGYSNGSGSGSLMRYTGYAIAASQPTSFASATSSAVLVDKVAACSMTYTAGTGGPRGIFIMTLRLQDDNEAVTLTYQVQVNNAP